MSPADAAPSQPNTIAVRASAAVAEAAQPCDYCADPIVWTITENARRMPVNAEATPGGNVLLHVDNASLVARVIGTAAERVRLERQGFTMRVHHKLTCRYADRWAGPPASRRPAGRPQGPTRRGAGQGARTAR